jgi:DNA-directed RNA polymerase subunit RPC12/RpoP
MAIQFACPSCRQPIEIDDEYGGRQVSCPYCHHVVAAPTRSTLEPPSPGGATPEARGLPETSATSAETPPAGATPTAGQPAERPLPPGFPPFASPPTGVAAQVKTRNVAGIVGLSCGVLTLLLYAVAVGILMSHLNDIGIKPNEKFDQARFQKRLMELTQEQAKHPWLMSMFASFAGAMLCWVAGLICSAIGMSRRYRSRAVAVAGLVVAMFLPLMACAGVLAR